MNFLKEAFNNANSGDEFYTRYNDIAKELGNYNFSGMIVYCNCDNPDSSNFVKFFKDNFQNLGIKCLLATFNSSEPLLYRYDGINVTTKPIPSGRFQDNKTILNMCDIVVTNPPFSNGMAIELIRTVIGARKRFIIVGSITLGLKKGMIDLLSSGELKCGYNTIRNFDTPTGEGGKITTFWWTNMPVNKSPIPLTAKYDERLYPQYDNYDAINCDKVINIPADYNGKIGVPVSFLSSFSPEQFSILGVLNSPMINGKKIMSRLIINTK